jgi:hypothetical protein
MVSYEALTGKLLDADDVSRIGYINILDPRLRHLYRFWDTTRFAEYLHDCVAETIHTDDRIPESF